MRIIQILTHLNWGDAIGNDVLAIDDSLRAAGYDCSIMALKISEKLADRAGSVDFGSVRSDDLILFHKAAGDGLMKQIVGLPCKKGLIYHNITPAKFFLPYDAVMAWNLRRGRIQLRKYAEAFDFAWGDSEYNCRELSEARAKNVAVRPVFFDLNISEADRVVKEKLDTEIGTKILFVGRIAPNKKHEDIIKVYYYILNMTDPEAKLYLVGSWDGIEKYYAKLKGFASELSLSDDQVVFTGRVTEEEKEAYLQGADVLLCMSEHEGFCVPVLEAMGRDLPVIAYAKGAVPETLGESGILFRKKDYAAVADLIAGICSNPDKRAEIIKKQRLNLERFSKKRTEERFLNLIREVEA